MSAVATQSKEDLDLRPTVWDNPIFVRSRQVERRALGNGPRALLHKFGGSLLILFGPLGLCLLFAADEMRSRPLSWFCEALGPVLSFSAFLLVLYFTGRALNGTFNGITVEKEQRTFDTLLATRIGPAELVAGKLASGLWPVVREMAVTGPLGLGLGLLAGYPLQSLIFLLLCFASAVLFSLLGLTTSYSCSSTQRASRRSTALASFLLLGGPMVDWFLYGLVGLNGSGGEFTPVAMYLSPLAAAGSIANGGATLWIGTVTLYALGSAVLWTVLLRQAQQARQQ